MDRRPHRRGGGGRIETAERNRALLKPPQSLDAWESFHRGLWHMYRFTVADNEQAQHLFRRRRDGSDLLACPCRSFVHAFSECVFAASGQREGDRAGHRYCGRKPGGGQPRSGRPLGDGAGPLAAGFDTNRRQPKSCTSVELSSELRLRPLHPGIHQSPTGDAAAIGSADRSCHLSPFDPLMFGMLGARALALFRHGRIRRGRRLGDQGVCAPNAHVHIHAIAAHCLADRRTPQGGTAVRYGNPHANAGLSGR
jgi:hypothetical protein